ncbi:methyltransferase domain-containing protein [Variovorax paradoxus]|nr:methyltransferase domain-containing protein [Variovorax paradoxus]
MNRQEKLLDGINLSSSVIAEIGALCNPLLTKAEADIRYIDYADAETLRRHYSHNALIDPEKIVETDAIWGKQTLLEALNQRVDFIVASHVIEHVPDLIAWLSELYSALTEQGQVRLAIPDRRFTFDFLRRETELSDVLTAYITSPRVPQPHAIFDYYLNATPVDHLAAWRGEVNEDTLQRPRNYEAAMDKAKDIIANGNYHDAHCWVFTPKSFATLLEQLGALGLISFECDCFNDTEPDTIEFFVALRPSKDVAAIVESWQKMAKTVRLDVSVPLSEIDARSSNRPTMEKIIENRNEIALSQERQISDALLAEVAELRQSLQCAQEEITQLRHSRSWTLTRPLRALSTTLRSLKG